MPRGLRAARPGGERPHPENPETGRARRGLLSIGALSRACGIPAETLRTWERRYGYPVPDRKASGQRVYPLASVPRLRRIAEALSHGHRPGEVVAASEDALLELLRTVGRHATVHPAPSLASGDEPDPQLLRAVERFDGVRLAQVLYRDWGALGPVAFLRVRVAPLVRAVGDGWATGRLEVRHEHFLSERLGDLLRAMRLPLEERARGAPIVLATLPGEQHTLGLQMVALLLTAAGCHLAILGAEAPLADIAALARDVSSRAVGISVSRHTRGSATARQLTRLRALLPHRMGLVVGGEGAPRARAGVRVIQDMEELDAWGRRPGAAT
jgi:methanogenic corrinoid protein MtbC1